MIIGRAPAAAPPRLQQMVLAPAPPTPRCTDGSAYLSLLTVHNRTGKGGTDSTFTARSHTNRGRTGTQLKLLLVLVRSLRRVERCRRDFVLLTGGPIANLPPAAWAPLLRERRVVLQPAPTFMVGVPSADKLEAWRLTRYSRILAIDTDVMALAPFDDLFDRPAADFSIAHHPYDEVQGPACGIPRERRGVGAMFMLRPDRRDHAGLRAHLSTYSAWHMQHFSEQTGLNCYFANRSATLPCSALYDVGTLRHTVGGLSHTSCVKLSPYGKAACDAAAAQSLGCSWPRVRTDARAVHFKGRLKPWHHHPSHCRPLRDGALATIAQPADPGGGGGGGGGGGASANVSVRDNLSWDAKGGRCVNLRGLPVRWASGKPVPKVCCFVDTLLQSEWFRLLDGYVADLSGLTEALERQPPPQPKAKASGERTGRTKTPAVVRGVGRGVAR